MRHLASIPDYKISGADILRLHGIIAKDLIPDAGQLRDHDVVITGATFTPPSFRDLPVKMESIGIGNIYSVCSFINTDT
jgi:hypothetical protein